MEGNPKRREKKVQRQLLSLGSKKKNPWEREAQSCGRNAIEKKGGARIGLADRKGQGELQEGHNRGREKGGGKNYLS